MKRGLRRLLRILAYPYIGYLGPKFHKVHDRFNELGPSFDAVQDKFNSIQHRLGEFEVRVSTDVETASELAITMQRAAGKLDQQVDKLEDLLASDFGRRLVELDPRIQDYAAHLLTGTALQDLGPGAAEFLNWADSHLGLSAQKHLWFNPPISLVHIAGDVRPSHVNERILEAPYALAAAGRLPAGSRVLDVGAAESTLSLSMACLGLEVTALDPRGYPFEHPRLTVVTDAVERWGPADQLFDAIFCISTIEHLGLGAYHQEPADLDLDGQVMESFRSWLSSRGQIILTTPYGPWAVDGFQRTYDSDHLDRLFKGWNILDRNIFIQTDDLTWERRDKDPDEEFWEQGGRAVIMMRAASDS